LKVVSNAPVGTRLSRRLIPQEVVEGALPVRVVRDAVVGLRTVVLGVEEVLLPVDVEHRSGREELRAVLERLSDAHLAALAEEAAGLDERVHAGCIRRTERDDVDHGEERIAAVERRAGAADHLDVVDGLEIDSELGSEVGRLVDVVVVDVPVDEQQDAVVVVAGSEEAADADVAVVAIVAPVEPADRAERLGERAVAEAADLLARDDGDRRRRFASRLNVLGRGADGRLLEEEELARRRRLGVGRRGRRVSAEEEQAHECRPRERDFGPRQARQRARRMPTANAPRTSAPGAAAGGLPV
jgi:hypothetical protein